MDKNRPTGSDPVSPAATVDGPRPGATTTAWRAAAAPDSVKPPATRAAPGDATEPTGLFDALAPLVTVFGAVTVGFPATEILEEEDPFQALVADIAIERSRAESAPNGERRRALLRAVAELAETHAVAADLACEQAAIDLPLDVPDPVRSPVATAAADGAAAKPMLIVPDMIRTCRDRLSAHTSDADRTKIDIVAALFDRVLSDDRLATHVRNTLARLQLPVLRMALADDSFFLSRTHPTRRLLDRLEASAAEWQRDSPSARAGLAALERVVHKVIRGSSEDAAHHALMLDEFERAIVDIATAESEEPEETVPDSEDRDVLVIRATIQLSQLLAGVEVDRTVRFFMLDVWSRVIVEIACRPPDDDRDALLARAKRLCFDIAWTSAPKTTSGERARLAGLLPTMIAAIRDGLRVIDYPEAEERKFFADWTRVLIQAVRGTPGTPFRASDVDLEGLTIDAFAQRLREGSFGPETVGTAGARPPGLLPSAQDLTASMLHDPGPTLRDDATDDADATTRGDVTVAPESSIEATRLEKGQWFDLRNGDRFSRVRLSWISPLRSFFLFIGADSALTRSLDPGTISTMAARGDLRRASKRRSDS